MSLAGKVALVVGGTSGIGRGFAEWLAQNGASVCISGRNRERGDEVVASMKSRCPSDAADAQFAFLPVDAMLIKDTNRFCEEYMFSHSRLDYLVLTPGIAYFGARLETSEGLEQKMAIHYYGRVSIILGLMPLLERTAADDAADVRVLSVLSAGMHGPYSHYREDPELVNNFSLANCANATSLYNDVAVTSLAEEHPRITFCHANPGMVNTNWGSDFNPLLKGLVRIGQLFAKSPITCATQLSPVLVSPEFKGGAVFSSQTAQRVSPNTAAQPGKEFIWKHTLDVIKRLGGKE